MAITRAQQAKQMLQDGGRIGLRRGGVNEADVEAGLATQSMSDFSPSEGGTGTGAVDTGDFGSESENVAAVLDANRFRENKGKSIFIPTPFNLIKNLLSKGDFKNKFVDASNLRSRTNFLNKIGYGGQFTPEFIKSDLGLQTLRNLGYTTMQDRLDNTEDDDDSTPLFPRSGIMAQAPEEKKEEDEDPPKYFDRLLAEGGRAGFQEGGGIEQRLEKLGGDVSSAEQMLQGINQRLKTAESSLGSGGGIGGLIPGQPIGTPGAIGPNMASSTPGVGPSIANITVPPPPPGTKFTPLPLDPMARPGGRPILEPLIEGPAQPLATLESAGDPFQNPAFEEMKPFGVLPFDLMDPRGTRYNSIEAAFNNAQDSAKIMRMTGRRGPDILPGEMSFDDYKRFFTIDDEGFITNTTGADKFYEKDLTSDPNRFETSSYYDTFRNPDSPFYGKSGDSMMGIAKDRYVPLPTSGLISGLPSGIPAAGFADGGNVVGGEYDFESARQMYGLGKLVKKITKSVKKIAKSPLGKVAIGAALFKFGPPLFKEGGAFNKFFFAGKAPSLGALTTKGALTGIAGISALGGLTAEQDDEEQQYAGADFPNPVDFYLSGQAPMNIRLAAEGGLMRAGYQEGSKEPVAKKTMPLLDMGGMEKDYREEGGFVPIGRMEKADDVPARLSKNEFVFTADAVRNAGDGDVDLGAEKMYNMMKNLEAGGDVSEESQGLKGAREMFQTSQRLEEVL